MAAKLQYEIGVIGEDRFKRVMRGVGAELKALERQSAVVARNARANASRTAVARSRLSIPGMGDIAQAARLAKKAQADMARGFAQVARVGMTADRKAYQEKIRMERARHALAMRHQQTEQKNLFNGLAQIGKVAAREEARRFRGRANPLAGFAAIGAVAGREQVRRHRAATAARGAAVARFGRGAASTLSNAGRNVAGLGGTALGMAGLVGGFAAGSAVADEIEVAKRASQLANQAGRPEIKGDLAKKARGVTGFSGVEALSGIEAFVTKTGDLESATNLIGGLGRLALATGSDLGDLGMTAGQVFNVLKDGPGTAAEKLEEVQSIMATLAQQGALGAVEIRDLAQNFGKLGAATRGFEGGSSDLMRTMGAFAQLAVDTGGADTSADAATAAARLSGDIVTHKKKFKALGVNIKSKTDPTKLRDPMEIFADVLQKTGGDVEKTTGLFGLESQKVFKSLVPTFADAEKKEKGSGRAAIMARYNKFFNATVSPEEIEKRAKSREGDADIKIIETTKRFNEAVGTRLLPVITDRLVPAFESLIPHLATAADKVSAFAEFFNENPVTGLGAILGAAVAIEVTKSGLASILSSAATGIATRAAAALGIGTAAASTASGAATGAGGGMIGGLIGGAATKGGALLTSALGAGGAAVASVGAAAAGVGAAAYQGYKLYQETGGFSDFGTDRANTASGSQYDEMMRKAGITPGGGQQTAKVNTEEVEAALVSAGGKVGEVIVAKLEQASVTNPRRFTASSNR